MKPDTVNSEHSKTWLQQNDEIDTVGYGLTE